MPKLESDVPASASNVSRGWWPCQGQLHCFKNISKQLKVKYIFNTYLFHSFVLVILINLFSGFLIVFIDVGFRQVLFSKKPSLSTNDLSSLKHNNFTKQKRRSQYYNKNTPNKISPFQNLVNKPYLF